MLLCGVFRLPGRILGQAPRDLAHSIEVRERLREAGYAPYESEPLGGLASSP